MGDQKSGDQMGSGPNESQPNVNILKDCYLPVFIIMLQLAAEKILYLVASKISYS